MAGVHSLELGVRPGERRYVLKALLGQHDKATLRWLAGEARLWSQKHREWSTAAIPIAEFWASRASDTAVLLDQLARDL